MIPMEHCVLASPEALLPIASHDMISWGQGQGECSHDPYGDCVIMAWLLLKLCCQQFHMASWGQVQGESECSRDPHGDCHYGQAPSELEDIAMLRVACIDQYYYGCLSFCAVLVYTSDCWCGCRLCQQWCLSLVYKRRWTQRSRSCSVVCPWRVSVSSPLALDTCIPRPLQNGVKKKKLSKNAIFKAASKQFTQK